ncbi:MAG: hypothetical protein AUJ54_11775 [Ignavibacteria bacterium CG1_02_37_35]|nr:MAG: hypothetical protein AUJ54_11775 [Ignavibacteria bacterium CG1_02_37_35]
MNLNTGLCAVSVKMSIASNAKLLCINPAIYGGDGPPQITQALAIISAINGLKPKYLFLQKTPGINTGVT